MIRTAEVESAAGLRSSVGLSEIQGVSEDDENLGAVGVADHDIGMGTGVIKELIEVFKCLGGCFGL
jgi:hypothetical protein